VWWKRKKNNDDLRQQLIDLLFPGYIEKIFQGGIKVHVDHSIDNNLDYALIDLQLGHEDETTRRAIEDAVQRLHRVRLLLGASMTIPSNVLHIIVEPLPAKRIVASEEA